MSVVTVKQKEVGLFSTRMSSLQDPALDHGVKDLPPQLHNFVVLICIFLTFLWIGKVIMRVRKMIDLNAALKRKNVGALYSFNFFPRFFFSSFIFCVVLILSLSFVVFVFVFSLFFRFLSELSTPTPSPASVLLLLSIISLIVAHSCSCVDVLPALTLARFLFLTFFFFSLRFKL